MNLKLITAYMVAKELIEPGCDTSNNYNMGSVTKVTVLNPQECTGFEEILVYHVDVVEWMYDRHVALTERVEEIENVLKAYNMVEVES